MSSTRTACGTMLREFARRDRRVRGVPVRGLTRRGLTRRGFTRRGFTRRGFTLIELLAALLVLSLLALMSYRSLGAVLDAREHVREESAKWRRIEAFYARFKQDVQLAAPRTVRTPGGSAPAWLGSSDSAGPHLAFSRFASSEGVDLPRRVGYGRNDRQEVELTVWPGLDLAPDAQPARYAVLGGVSGRNVVEARRLFGPQDMLDPRARHEFRFCNGRAGQTDRPFRDLPFRNVHAFMNLYVWAHIHAGRLGLLRHLLHILFEHGQIDHHARRRQNALW